jgi:hypothetical protein
MATFVIVTTHSSDQCPTANAKIRQLVTADPTAMMKLAEKLGVKMIAGPYVGVGHRGFSVVEAPKVEAVYDLAMQSGLVQWNSVDIVPVQHQEQGLKEAARLKPIY